MYKIYLDEYPIYDVRDKEYVVDSPQLTLEINKLGALKFKIYRNHPYFDRLEKLTSVLTVFNGNRAVFKGRLVSDEQGLQNEKNIECEGVLGYLNDSIVRPYSFNGTPAEHFTNLFDIHNSQVAEHQQLKVGTITVTDPNDYIVRSSINYATTWDVLNGDLINKLGGYLRVRYEADGTYVDYLEDFDDTSTQVIELGQNLIDVLVKNDAANVYTAVIPLGAEIENEDGAAERLTVKSVNDGLDYLVNQEAFEKYGLIFAPISQTTWDDVTLASNLKTKGTNYLNNQAVMLKSSIEASAADLGLIDEQVEEFMIYEYIRFVSKFHNMNQRFLLNKLTIALDKPKNKKVTLGKETSSLTGIQMGNGSKLDNAIEKIGIVEKNYQINETVTNEKINGIRDEVQTNITSIQQSQEELALTVAETYVAKGEYETYQESVSTQFSQTKEDFNFQFNNVTSHINELDGSTQQQFQEINKYIRFVDGNIILGESGNEITLKIENDRIAFIQNNNEVAYFSDDKLTVTDGEFLNSLIIGNFAWKPRANGNLSLVYIGGESSGN